MSLSDAKVRNARPQVKPYKIYDGEGLYLLVAPTGVKCWRFRYQFGGKEKLLALGIYPAVALSAARERSAQARKHLANGNDPSELKKVAKQEAVIRDSNSFETVAREWFEKRKHEWAASSAKTTLKRLETHAFPALGKRPIAEIKAKELLSVLVVIQDRGTLETAHRIKQLCGQVFMYAIVTARAERNPALDLDGALKSPVTKHHSYLSEDDLPDFLKALNKYDGELQTKLALRLLMLTFVRTIELRGARWSEIDFEKSEWRIPAERMKMREQHIVPLSDQAVSALLELKQITGKKEYIFPNHHNLTTYMTENTMLYAIYRLGYHSRTTGHGFRSTASTILNENGFKPDVIERQLAHCERDKVRAAYNYAQYLPERRKMMQWWANHLDKCAKKKEKRKSV